MRSVLTKVCVLLPLLGIVLATVLEPRRGRSKMPDKFICDDAEFSPEILHKFARIAKKHKPSVIFGPSKWLGSYDGPPFTNAYWVWPISLNSEKSYEQAMSEPFRVILDREFKVFSVVAKRESGVQECKLEEKVESSHEHFNYRCGTANFPFDTLYLAAQTACFHIHEVLNDKFPARYDGPDFSRFGKQLYLYPIILDNYYQSGVDPGPYRVVMNSACAVVGAISIPGRGESFACQKLINRRERLLSH